MNSEKSWLVGAGLTEQPGGTLKATVLPPESRVCLLLSAAWSSPAACAGRSAAAPQPRGQAAWPGRASVPRTASLSPGERESGS